MSQQVVKLTVDMEAVAKARKDFAKFPAILAKELERAMKRLVLIIEAKAKELCPVDTGLLQSSITPVVESWMYGYVGTNVVYAPHVEYGTGPHEIRAKDSPILANADKGIIFGKSVNHPGTEAQPFFEPAFLYGKKQAKRMFNAAFRRALQKVGGQ